MLTSSRDAEEEELVAPEIADDRLWNADVQVSVRYVKSSFHFILS